MQQKMNTTRRPFGRAHLPPTKVFRRLSEYTIIKPRLTYTWDFRDVKFSVAAQLAGSLDKAAKFRSLYNIGESNPVPASRLWSGSGSKVNKFVHVSEPRRWIMHFTGLHSSLSTPWWILDTTLPKTHAWIWIKCCVSTDADLSTRNISSKSMHAFFSDLANRQTGRQTDKQTRTKTCTYSFVGASEVNYALTPHSSLSTPWWILDTTLPVTKYLIMHVKCTSTLLQTYPNISAVPNVTIQTERP